MDAPCKIQGSIHVFRLVNNMCPGKWVHIIDISLLLPFLLKEKLINYEMLFILLYITVSIFTNDLTHNKEYHLMRRHLEL